MENKTDTPIRETGTADDTVTRRRGRPRTTTPAPDILYKDFMCIYANAVAQLHQRTEITPRPEAKADKDPVKHIGLGDFIILYTLPGDYGLETRLYTVPVQTGTRRGSLEERAPDIINRIQGTAICERLWNDADEEDRFGRLEGHGSHILYRNRYYEVAFAPTTTEEIPVPFLIVHTRTRNVQKNIKGKVRRYRTFHAAMDKADELSRDEAERRELSKRIWGARAGYSDDD